MIKTITIGFSKPKNKTLPILSWLIRLFLKTEYSHVYLQFYSESINREIIYEAVGKGVRFIGLKRWKLQAQEVLSYTINIKECNRTELIQWCVDNAGHSYSFWQNIGILISSLLNTKNNIFTKGKNCSELIAKILKLEGYKIEKDLNLITPKDIEEILKMIPKTNH